MKKLIACMLIIAMALVQTACVGENDVNEVKVEKKELKHVKLILDFLPNTNHTGFYVAKNKGYYKDMGIDLEIVEPTDGVTNALVATGKGEFGISYQEDVTYAHTTKDKLPIKAIATLIQHNTSGIGSYKAKNIDSPKEFEGKVYAGWGSPAEAAVLHAIMKAKGADPNKLEIITASDLNHNMLKKHIDLVWMFWAWDVIPAKLEGFDINFQMVSDYDKRLDYYTPVIVTSDKIINEDPELVKDFLLATEKGYKYCIENPEEGAKILAKNVTSYDENVVIESQKYLSGKYIDDAKNWGEMKDSVWKGYMDFMKEYKLIEKEVPTDECYTNEFLPYKNEK